MDFIQICEYNGEAVTTSRAVAEQFGKQHKNVIQSIEEIISQLNGLKNQPVNPEANTQTAEFAERNFFLSEYTDPKGETRKQYILTRDGFTLLAMGFTGAKALQFKVAYINAFDRMEELIKGTGAGMLESARRAATQLEEVEDIAGAGRSTAADAANADNCIADYHFSMETAAENGKDITKFSIVFEN